MYVKWTVSAADEPWNNQRCVSGIELYRREFLVVVMRRMCASELCVFVIAGNSLHWHVLQQLYSDERLMLAVALLLWTVISDNVMYTLNMSLVHDPCGFSQYCTCLYLPLCGYTPELNSVGTAIGCRTKLLWHCNTKHNIGRLKPCFVDFVFAG